MVFIRAIEALPQRRQKTQDKRLYSKGESTGALHPRPQATLLSWLHIPDTGLPGHVVLSAHKTQKDLEEEEELTLEKSALPGHDVLDKGWQREGESATQHPLELCPPLHSLTHFLSPHFQPCHALSAGGSPLIGGLVEKA